MNPRRLLPLTLACAVTFGVVADPHTTERITPTAAAVSVPPTRTVDGIPTPDQPPIDGDCASLFSTAMRAGWDWNTWPRVAYLAGRETGCQANPPCPDRCPRWWQDYGNSFGYLQIHVRDELWWKPIGWGETRSVREACGEYPGQLVEIERLYGTAAAKAHLRDPYVNFQCARVLYEARGWAPWA